MRDFRTLSVCQKAHLLAVAVYQTTGHFPKEETYGLTSQVRRVGVSIPANIAEGCGRDGEAEFGRFLQIAQGSASELEYHLLFARELHLLNSQEYELLSGQHGVVRRMLTTLMKRLKEQPLALKGQRPANSFG